MDRPLGKHHPTIRRLRALRRDASLRREDGVFLAEGIHLAHEALQSEAPIELVVTAPRLSASDEGRALLDRLSDGSLRCVEASDAAIEGIQDARSPQPITMLVRRCRPEPTTVLTPTRSPLVLTAVGVQDPGNLGSLVRSADAAGSTAIVVCEGSADPYHPRAVRATMGSIFRVPILECSLADAVAIQRRVGLRLLGTSPREGLAYHEAELTGPVSIFVGAEGSGLSARLRDDLDDTVRVAMRAGVESLSVGAAAAVVLFEAARQRASAAQPSDL